ncbi:MAG: QacE family quaternary ammonium compound efflux SMR transporter [Ignavibacteria bacterium]|nr:QacE family quaternary ammonium compound efflux SMR transporter [Ignavibacteria bacterium]
MNWLYLLIASVLEIGWVISLKYTEGFTKFVPILFYAFFGFFSAFFFSNSLKTIPLGIAYSIWMGIAVIGTTAAEIVVFNKPFHSGKLLFVTLIIIGIIGLKMSTAAK